MRSLMLALVAGLVLSVGSLSAQVGKSVTVVDVNTITEADLLKAPHMTPPIAKAIVAARPFASILDFNALLRKQGLTEPQATEIYSRVFVHINLNTATAEEIMLIPGAGKRMAREFAEYRPWKVWAQFDKEIGKYVNAAGSRATGAVRLHPAQPQHGVATPTFSPFPASASACCASSRNTARGRRANSSTGRSANTWIRRKSAGWRATWSFREELATSAASHSCTERKWRRNVRKNCGFR